MGNLASRIKAKPATVYFAPTMGRRYLTRRAAIRAEARAMISKKYPSEHDDNGTCVWHWGCEERFTRLYARLTRILAATLKET